MKTTLLLDLDNTLISNDMDTFVPVYLQSLSRFMSAHVQPGRLVGALMEGTQRMERNRQPDCTLEQVFGDVFYPQIGLSPQAAAPLFEQYYQRVYPELQAVTTPRPAAQRLVQSAFERGWQVAITTNPLFPRSAIEQRLAWAGLPVTDYPFELVTSYEGFHFTKPHPAYYAEVLARLGYPDGRIVVVGDDWLNEVQAGRLAGLATYWLPQGRDLPGDHRATDGIGELEDVLPWIDAQEPKALLPDYDRPAAMLANLRGVPAALHTWLQDLPPEAWLCHPDPKEWCLTEILCHLRDVEHEVNLPRLRKVLGEDNPFLAGMDTDPWAVERSYYRQNGPQAFQRYLGARQELVTLLEDLDETGWQRPARHAIFSHTTLAELVRIITGHDRLHCRQVLHSL